jgi:enoyl-CoA hydratase/carnithine racemase
MTYLTLTLTLDHHVATVALNSPPANVLSRMALFELSQVFGDLETNRGVRAVLITGTGRLFCAGADIKELALVHTARQGFVLAQEGQALLSRIERLDLPVVAALNGTCLGGGLELAMACHVRLAAAGVMLGLPETKLGLIPGFGGTQRLARIIGPARAAELILTGEMMSAEQAFAWGLVNRVVPESQLMADARALAISIAEKSRPAIQAALRAIRSGLDSPMAEGLSREAELFGELCETPEKKEGIQAFLEKRAPRFTGD